MYTIFKKKKQIGIYIFFVKSTGYNDLNHLNVWQNGATSKAIKSTVNYLKSDTKNKRKSERIKLLCRYLSCFLNVVVVVVVVGKPNCRANEPITC